MQNKIIKLKLLLWKIGSAARKGKYVLLVLVALVAGLLVWQYHKNNINDNWKKATDYYRKANYDAAAKILNKMPIPTKDADKLAIYAQTMLATRQLDKAATAYTDLYNLKKDPFAELVLGNIYNEQKQYPQAQKIYQKLIDSNPSYDQAYVNLATLYKLQGNNSAAISTAQKGVTNNPNSIVLNELLVSLTMTDKNSQQFKDAVAKLKKLNPNDPLLVVINQH